MWKALIKWVESWSYRCEHDWDNGQKISTFKNSWDKLPTEIFEVYICKKCKESKKVKL